jgi:hypothetical protein
MWKLELRPAIPFQGIVVSNFGIVSLQCTLRVKELNYACSES